MNFMTKNGGASVGYPKGFRRKNKALKGGGLFYASIVVLPILQFIVFYIVVNFNSFLMAFQSYDNSTGVETIKYTFGNFSYFFDKIVFADLWLCIKNSLLYLALNIVVCIPISLLFGYYVYKKFWFSTVFKVILFLPSIVCSTAMVIFYKYFVNEGLFSVFGGSVSDFQRKTTRRAYSVLSADDFFGEYSAVYKRDVTNIGIRSGSGESRRGERTSDLYSRYNSSDMGDYSVDYSNILRLVCDQSGVSVHLLRFQRQQSVSDARILSVQHGAGRKGARKRASTTVSQGVGSRAYAYGDNRSAYDTHKKPDA